MSSDVTRVGIAVVEHRGRFLVGFRSADSALPGDAEFPGGKCLEGESAAQCARRECLEETGLAVRNVDLLMHREFNYPHGSVDLEFWLCHPVDAEAVREDHHGYRWFRRDELSALRFPEANQPLIVFLSQT